MKHYLKSANDVMRTVDSNTNGLNSSEAAKRLATNGKNKLIEAKKESMFHRFLKQLCEPMTIILLVAAAISAVFFKEKLSKKIIFSTLLCLIGTIMFI